MFSKFREWLDKFDDERFLADVATPESCKAKIAKLKRVRSLQLLVLIFMGCWIILVICLYPVGNLLSITFILVEALFSAISVLAADSQIKMLLLFEQTQPNR